MTKEYVPPLEFRISLPTDIEYKYGALSTTAGHMIQVRVSSQDVETLKEVCNILQIGRSNLIRHCVIKYCESLLKHKKEWEKRKVNNDDSKDDPS
jgi:hypothetical protein